MNPEETPAADRSARPAFESVPVSNTEASIEEAKKSLVEALQQVLSDTETPVSEPSIDEISDVAEETSTVSTAISKACVKPLAPISHIGGRKALNVFFRAAFIARALENMIDPERKKSLEERARTILEKRGEAVSLKTRPFYVARAKGLEGKLEFEKGTLTFSEDRLTKVCFRGSFTSEEKKESIRTLFTQKILNQQDVDRFCESLSHKEQGKPLQDDLFILDEEEDIWFEAQVESAMAGYVQEMRQVVEEYLEQNESDKQRQAEKASLPPQKPFQGPKSNKDESELEKFLKQEMEKQEKEKEEALYLIFKEDSETEAQRKLFDAEHEIEGSKKKKQQGREEELKRIEEAEVKRTELRRNQKTD